MKSSPAIFKKFFNLDFISVMLASVFFISYLPAKLVSSYNLKFRGESLTSLKLTGAGLAGSVAGALTFLLLPAQVAQSKIALLLGLALAIGVSGRAEKILGVHDDSRIVIDEWIGVWIALWGFPHRLGLTLIVAFILFRVFDVYKGPWGRYLQKLPGGFGVTLDDVAAGIVANFLTRVFVALGLLG